MNQFTIGAQVTVRPGAEDSSHLWCHPQTAIAEVVTLPDGPDTYYVEHAQVSHARRYGPFNRDRLWPGW